MNPLFNPIRRKNITLVGHSSHQGCLLTLTRRGEFPTHLMFVQEPKELIDALNACILDEIEKNKVRIIGINDEYVHVTGTISRLDSQGFAELRLRDFIMGSREYRIRLRLKEIELLRDRYSGHWH